MDAPEWTVKVEVSGEEQLQTLGRYCVWDGPWSSQNGPRLGKRPGQLKTEGERA